MKPILFLLTYALILVSGLQAQTYDQACRVITTFEQDPRIIDRDYTNLSKVKEDQEKLVVLARKVLDSVFLNKAMTDLEIAARLDCFRSAQGLTWLEWALLLHIWDLEDTFEITGKPYKNENGSPAHLKHLQSLVQQRLSEVMPREYTLYGFTESSNKWAKAIYVEHQNDVFSFYNQDRDLTGAFRFEVYTDKFKMRAFNSRFEEMPNWNSRNWYSYQSVFIGGEGYTPYLRDTTIFNQDNSYDTLDRPYASFAYFGRAKNRVTRSGRFRVFTQIKVGSIGGRRGDNIQSAIHRDITIKSQKPYGWGAQIAAGGRIAVSQEALLEFLPNRLNFSGFKWSFMIDEKFGYDQTSMGASFNFSNRSLKQRAQNGFSFFYGTDWRNILCWNVRPYVKYVFHNSMLEGYGVLNRDPDENPNSPVDVYYLTRGRNGTPDQINEWIYGCEFSVSVTFKYFTLLYRGHIWSPEFILPVNSITYPYADGGRPGSHNKSPWNHTGTIGAVFVID